MTFVTGGALAVKDGKKIIKYINERPRKFDTIILTQDWHPKEHSSFASNNNAEALFKYRDGLWSSNSMA